MKPSEYYRMGYGEKQVIRAFMHYEAEKRKEEADKIETMSNQ
jgi:hypothetical protein